MKRLKILIKKGIDYCKKPKYIREYVRIDTSPIFKEVFVDKTVVVTGGASGIGYAAAKKFAETGANVILVGRNEKKLKDAKDKMGGQVSYYCWDISDFNEMDEKISEIFDICGDVDIWVNCAGVNAGPDGKPYHDWMKISLEEWDHTININLKANYFMIQKLAAKWIENGSADNIKHIVNIASSAGVEPTVLPYGVSKWGVVGMTKGFGRSLAPYGIIVNGVAPGPTATAMAGMDEKSSNLRHSCVPSGRYATPEEIANMILLLSSNYSNNIVGEILVCDGGLNLSVSGGQ